MVTKASIGRIQLGVFVLAAGLLVSGCSQVENAISKFTGGSKSSAKKGAVPAKVVNPTPSTPQGNTPGPMDSTHAASDSSAAHVSKGATPKAIADSANAMSDSTVSVETASLPAAIAEPAVAMKSDVATSAPAPVGDPVTSNSNLRENFAAYKAQGWRDPFVSLVSSERLERDTNKVDLSVVTLVAIVRGEGETFCVVEDAEGTSYILREGDPVRNGKLVRIGGTSVTATQTVLGYTTQVQLELIERKDVKNG